MGTQPPSADPLDLFLPPVRAWFRAALGSPTPVQRQGWPVIAAGQNALLLAPTGSGKTLAAFLACLDGLWRQSTLPRGVQVLYVSPLKALNNDIYRNLQLPLDGVRQAATDKGFVLPEIRVAVRTGDTSTAERQRLLRKPPHVLITTPESLHLLLTSRARETLRGVTHCIVDEIHALCPNKRGVFLTLLLERLEEINPRSFVRIGLSATQRPLEEVARFLGGLNADAHAPRPVTIVDAGLRKNLDLRVLSPVEQFGPLPEKSVWPSIYRLLADLVDTHRSTIIFTNNRRAVERITTQLQELLEERHAGEDEKPAAFVKAHHGSVSLEVRQQTEHDLKEGRLRAVVATASLELGIDMGAVDLVCQVESPGNVARGLQRVGRAGHLVGQQSKGRLIAKTLPDLVDQAVLAAEMAAGHVEELRVPTNCLDVLAQQIVAMVAMDPWPIDRLYQVVRRAYPFRDLTPRALDAVLDMISGRYRFAPATEAAPEHAAPAGAPPPLSALQPRVSWDRVHHRLEPLPGTQRLALVNGGTIPDTGQFAVVTRTGLRVGEVDEEFVWERRVGEAFLLGTTAWRIDTIETDRVIVEAAHGAPAMIPFWRGEMTGRTYDLGLAQARFLRRLEANLDAPDCLDWLQKECFLDPPAARQLRAYVRRQKTRTGCVPSDRLLWIEAARDPLGDWQVVLLCPLGSAVNLTLRFALEKRLTQRLGYRPQCVHHDEGLLIRLTESDEPILDVLEGITPENLEDLVLEELADSALFALRFRQNAARALLTPRGQAGRRAPLWLQRLRGRDLLQVARRHPDFPILAETFRECLHDHLHLDRVQQLLADVGTGNIEVRSARLEGPSPFAASLLFAFQVSSMYQEDAVEGESGSGSSQLDRELLDHLVSGPSQQMPLDPRAVQQVERRLRGVGRPPRSKTEMAEWLRRLGDLADDELEGPMQQFLEELEREGRVQRLALTPNRDPDRWILAEEEQIYRRAFLDAQSDPDDQRRAAERVLQRFLDTHALVSLGAILARYPFAEAWARQQLEAWSRSGRLVAVRRAELAETVQWSAPENLEQVQRGTLAILRREVVPCPPTQYAQFLLQWQAVQPLRARSAAAAATGDNPIPDLLDRLQALFLPAEVWELAVLPARAPGYQSRWLDEALAGGAWLWAGRGRDDPGPGSVAFLPRADMAHCAAPVALPVTLDGPTEAVWRALSERGALFVPDLAQSTGLSPQTVRASLWSLVRLGLVTNDQFDVVRRGEERMPEHADADPGPGVRGRPGRLLRATPRARPRATSRPEGRWTTIPWGQPTLEDQVLHQARLLLTRYGVVAREIAQLDDALPPWRILYEVLSRLELAAEVRRGYFVEGLSGAQFALPEAASLLHDLTLPSSPAGAPVLLHSLDPANLYGSGAPFDIPLLEGGTRPFLRRPGNWLVLHAGAPILLIEQHGKRLTALPSARKENLARAVQMLPAIVSTTQMRDPRHRLTVETWNEQPVTATPGKDLLEAAGFVRDYQAMTWYAVWS